MHYLLRPHVSTSDAATLTERSGGSGAGVGNLKISRDKGTRMAKLNKTYTVQLRIPKLKPLCILLPPIQIWAISFGLRSHLLPVSAFFLFSCSFIDSCSGVVEIYYTSLWFALDRRDAVFIVTIKQRLACTTSNF